MDENTTYLQFFYGFIAVVLFAGSFWVKPKTNNWLYYHVILLGFITGGLIVPSYLLVLGAVLAILVCSFRLRRHIRQNRQVEVIFIADHEDHYLHHFIDFYRSDIEKYFPAFDFIIEDEYLVALIVSEMETVGLIIAEIKNAETLRICVDYMVPKHRNSQLAKTFYLCELHCVDFLGYRNLYIEPQSKAHNQYLERIGFRLIDGKYVNRWS